MPENKPEPTSNPTTQENTPKTAWEAWAVVLGIPAVSTAAAHFTKHNPVISLTVAGLSALGVIIIKPIGNELKTRYEKRVSTVIDERDRFGRGGFREKYLKHLEFRHRTFDVKGLSTTGPHSLELQRVFVELSMVSQAHHKTSTDPIRDVSQNIPTGRRTIWEYLQSNTGGSHNLAVIGAPGSGKTTLLKHMTLTLAAGKEQCKKDGAPFKLPIMLFLRDHADKIKTTPDYTLPQAVQDTLMRFQGPTPPTTDWFDKQLTAGDCLILLDGLDEVADTETRKKVIEWVEKQIGAHGNNLFVVSSRPGGYKDNPISDVNVVEVLPFSRIQQEQFVNNWYLANEIMSQQKNDEGVRLAAREGADDLLRRIRANNALADLAVNPLLLTMIAAVHRYRSSLPGRRVELYGEICEVFLGKRRAATGLTEDLTPLQKQRVLQPLAYEMMKREVREIPVVDAAKIIRDALWMASGNKIAPEVFLKAVEHGSGVLLERENSVYSFAHLTFQEYLTAIHILEKSLEIELISHVRQTWWHEVVRLYCAKAADATPVITACINDANYNSLALAVECESEGGSVQPQVRAQVRALLNEQIEDASPAVWRVAAETLLKLRLRRMVRVDEDRYVDTNLITHAEYQLFLDAMRGENKFYQPDHWKGCKFPVGQGRSPVTGVRVSDAIAFCEWLNKQEDEWQYRLPHPQETNSEPLQELSEEIFIGYWIKDVSRVGFCFVNRDLVKIKAMIKEAIDLSLNRDYEFDRILAQSVTIDNVFTPMSIRNFNNGNALNIDYAFKLDKTINYVYNLVYIFNRVNYNDIDHALNETLNRIRSFGNKGTLNRVRSIKLWIILIILKERRAGNLPAFEGIRIVKERVQAVNVDNAVTPRNSQDAVQQ